MHARLHTYIHTHAHTHTLAGLLRVMLEKMQDGVWLPCAHDNSSAFMKNSAEVINLYIFNLFTFVPQLSLIFCFST